MRKTEMLWAAIAAVLLVYWLSSSSSSSCSGCKVDNNYWRDVL